MTRSVHASLKVGLTLCWAGLVALGATGCSGGDAEDGPVVNDMSAGSSSTMPVFLMAGQSNMVGHTNPDLFQNLVNHLEQGSDADLQATLVEDLHNWYKSWDYALESWDPAMAQREASALIALRAAGLVDSTLAAPHSKVYCSINHDDSVPGAGTWSTPAPLAMVPYSEKNCGDAFGPELMLGHVLSKTTKFAPTSLIKVTVGGTMLNTEWRPPSSGGTLGPLYGHLRDRIHSLKDKPESVHPACKTKACRWAAFIWLQGENDAVDESPTPAAQYQDNLTNLLADVRSEVGDSSLPVIIVQIGAGWQTDAQGKTVAAAQQQVVSKDAHARLVKTSDLSAFGHWDSAAQLIVGQRVAQAVKSIVKP